MGKILLSLSQQIVEVPVPHKWQTSAFPREKTSLRHEQTFVCGLERREGIFDNLTRKTEGWFQRLVFSCQPLFRWRLKNAFVPFLGGGLGLSTSSCPEQQPNFQHFRCLFCCLCCCLYNLLLLVRLVVCAFSVVSALFFCFWLFCFFLLFVLLLSAVVAAAFSVADS